MILPQQIEKNSLRIVGEEGFERKNELANTEWFHTPRLQTAAKNICTFSFFYNCNKFAAVNLLERHSTFNIYRLR